MHLDAYIVLYEAMPPPPGPLTSISSLARVMVMCKCLGPLASAVMKGRLTSAQGCVWGEGGAAQRAAMQMGL